MNNRAADRSRVEREASGRNMWARRAAPPARVERRAGHAPVEALAPNTRVRASRRLPPEVLTDDEVRRLLAACRPTTPIGLRHHALITLLYRTGLRIREALDLFPKDIDLDAGVVRVLRGKCGYSRTVGIDPGAAAVVRTWLEVRSRLGFSDSGAVVLPRAAPLFCTRAGRLNPCESGEIRNGLGSEPRASALPHAAPLFCTRAGGRLCEAYVRVLLKRLARRAGIEKRVHAHGLRHTHAAQLRAECVDIGIISRQLGHRSICTTARYLDHIAPLAVIEAIRGRVWNP